MGWTIPARIRNEHCYGLSHTAFHRARQRREQTQRRSLRPEGSKKRWGTGVHTAAVGQSKQEQSAVKTTPEELQGVTRLKPAALHTRQDLHKERGICPALGRFCLERHAKSCDGNGFDTVLPLKRRHCHTKAVIEIYVTSSPAATAVQGRQRQTWWAEWSWAAHGAPRCEQKPYNHADKGSGLSLHVCVRVYVCVHVCVFVGAQTITFAVGVCVCMCMPVGVCVGCACVRAYVQRYR
jgi:hypothetical protein